MWASLLSSANCNLFLGVLVSPPIFLLLLLPVYSPKLACSFRSLLAWPEAAISGSGGCGDSSRLRSSGGNPGKPAGDFGRQAEESLTESTSRERAGDKNDGGNVAGDTWEDSTGESINDEVTADERSLALDAWKAGSVPTSL
jgi:hypothetical protein